MRKREERGKNDEVSRKGSRYEKGGGRISFHLDAKRESVSPWCAGAGGKKRGSLAKGKKGGEGQYFC